MTNTDFYVNMFSVYFLPVMQMRPINYNLLR